MKEDRRWGLGDEGDVVDWKCMAFGFSYVLMLMKGGRNTLGLSLDIHLSSNRTYIPDIESLAMRVVPGAFLGEHTVERSIRAFRKKTNGPGSN